MREEDQAPDCDPAKYYPARIGETLSGRYRMISKLGWGGNSTVWLAKDTTRSVLLGLDFPHSECHVAAHMAQMIRLLGLPPRQFLERADREVYGQLFSRGFRFPDLIPSEEFNFSNIMSFLEGEDRRLFRDFVRRMLCWVPRRRRSFTRIPGWSLGLQQRGIRIGDRKRGPRAQGFSVFGLI
ncbi:hypothetical protein BO70DRAFT_429204 [Aspergillus heteromorphus CBS 117.55]|uniref:non-specific serine/threonine protein kinase n=1 Tax=Aspergillus heteromorphus CBS 117.55 TaxID=1448321 RepID=A0A317W8T1_9EURO|nr:uncharacterized protein BO70DRAFT_429204 [Aspergillus heteromorphus CBS 117.55]PWY82141.1 hypothetical protein BO70DRAFT_429204 [Aspergillus heteromorphus CBS 117.55]